VPKRCNDGVNDTAGRLERRGSPIARPARPVHRRPGDSPRPPRSRGWPARPREVAPARL